MKTQVELFAALMGEVLNICTNDNARMGVPSTIHGRRWPHLLLVLSDIFPMIGSANASHRIPILTAYPARSASSPIDDVRKISR